MFPIDAEGAGVEHEHHSTHQHGGSDNAKEGDLEPIDTRTVHQHLDDDTVDAEDEGGDRSGEVSDQCAGFGYSH